jgi:hypothetical protein
MGKSKMYKEPREERLKKKINREKLVCLEIWYFWLSETGELLRFDMVSLCFFYRRIHSYCSFM